MPVQKKTIAQTEAATQDEIQEIMNEIESLQQGMAETAKPKPAPTPKLKAVPAPAAAPAEPEAVDPAANISGIEDFRGGGDSEVSMEDTLAGMKDESTGPTLLDVVVDETPIEEEEVVAEEAAAEEAPAEEVVAQEEEVQAEEEEPTIQAEIEEEQPMPKPTPIAAAHRGTQIASEAQDGELVMTLSGNMTLKLNYAFEGQVVTIGFADHCLMVKMSDGTEFKIPVARKTG